MSDLATRLSGTTRTDREVDEEELAKDVRGHRGESVGYTEALIGFIK